MKDLNKVMQEIEDFTKDIKYKDITNTYTISQLKNEYSHLYWQTKLEIGDLKHEIELLKLEVLKTK